MCVVFNFLTSLVVLGILFSISVVFVPYTVFFTKPVVLSSFYQYFYQDYDLRTGPLVP